MSALLPRIDRAVNDFIADEGRRPNVLIAGPQFECDLYELGLKSGQFVRGLRIIVDDAEPDFSVAYQKPR